MLPLLLALTAGCAIAYILLDLTQRGPRKLSPISAARILKRLGRCPTASIACDKNYFARPLFRD